MKLKTTNFVSIDVLRGFAAFSVASYHIGLGEILADTSGIGAFKIIDSIGTSLAVPLFFLISGFCIHLSQLNINSKTGSDTLNLKQYFVRRFWRIYPPYIIVVFFSCAVMAILNQHVGVVDFAIHVFVFQGLTVEYFNTINLVLWTITIEVLFYILYPVWYYIKSKTNLNTALSIAIGISIASWIAGIIFETSHILPFRWSVLNIWAGWVFGAWLAEKVVVENKKIINNKYWWITGTATICLLYGLRQFFKFNHAFYENNLVSIIDTLNIVIWAWPMVILIYLETAANIFEQKYTQVFIKLFQKIGIASYSLYLLHMPFINLFNHIYPNKNALSVSSVFVAILFLSWISYQLFEKPFLKYRIN